MITRKNIFYLISLFSIAVAFLVLPGQKTEAATLTLTPTSGVAGQEVFISGTGYDNSTAITVLWDGQPLTTNPSPTSTSGAGAIPAVAATPVSFVVPSGQFGAHTVRVSTSASNFQIATFTINTPVVAITSPAVPTAGLPVGVGITMTGTNFESLQLATIYFDDIPLTTATTTYNGAFQTTFTIPDVNNTGAHILKAQNSANAIANITVVVATPTITLSPSTAPAGLNVTVTGTNFKVGAPVTFLMNGAALTMDSSVTANGAGSFAATFSVPDLVQGTNTVKALSYSQLFAVATLTLATPTITVSPTSGPAGYTVSLTGTNFKAGSAVNLYINGTTLTPVAPVIANSAGSFVANVVIPDLSIGVNTIKAESYNNYYTTVVYTIATPAITLTPSGASTAPISSGLPVNIMGANFKSSSTVRIYVNNIEVSCENGSALTDATGYFGCTIIFPQVPAGVSTVKVVSYNELFAAATVTVGATAIAVTPASGPAGLPIFINGSGFEANTAVSFYFNGDLITGVTATTNAVGAFTAQVTVPKNTPSGAYTLRAQTNAINFANATFTVTASSMTVSPTSGSPGSRMVLSGSNFDPNSVVNLKWGGRTLTAIDGVVRTGDLGTFYATFTVPTDATIGSNQIEASTSSTNTAYAYFTVSTPTLTLSLSSGSPGAKVTVTGANFAGNQTIYLTWDDGAIVTAPATITSSSSGGFTAVVTIPKSNRGTHYLKATAGQQKLVASAQFTINAPTLTLDTTTSQPNMKIKVNGSSFTPLTAVTFNWDNNAITDLVESVISTDASGSFTATIKIPANASPGIHTLQANTSDDVFATIQITVTQGVLSISSEMANLGATITLSGSQFDAGKSVSLYLDGEMLTGITLVTDGIGGFSYQFALPSSIKVGEHTLVVKTSEYVVSEVRFVVNSPELYINPDKGRTGSVLSVRGTRFAPNADVGLFSNGRIIKTVHTDANGNFTSSVRTPMVLGAFTLSAASGDSDHTSVEIPVQLGFMYLVLSLLLLIIIGSVVYWFIRRRRKKAVVEEMAPQDEVEIVKTPIQVSVNEYPKPVETVAKDVSVVESSPVPANELNESMASAISPAETPTAEVSKPTEVG